MVAGLLLAALLEPRVMAQSLGSNCGLRSLQSLCELSGKQLDEMQMWGLYDKLQGEECSFLDVVNAGKPLGLDLEGVQATWNELLKVPGPGELSVEALWLDTRKRGQTRTWYR
jgi:ABC-type bacteriocin/lantibiotic exporter with double-glycine peptidase domain